VFSGQFKNAIVKNIYEIKNETAIEKYQFLEKSFAAKYKETSGEGQFYHGTSEKFLQSIYDDGFSLPSDYAHNSNCKRNKTAPAYSLCDNTCPDCCGVNKQKHVWKQCHMFGLGIYFANLPQ
jgi:hypothetical protein